MICSYIYGQSCLQSLGFQSLAGFGGGGALCWLQILYDTSYGHQITDALVYLRLEKGEGQRICISCACFLIVRPILSVYKDMIYIKLKLNIMAIE